MNIAGNICVIYNPKAGKGRAKRRMDRLRATLGGRAEFQPTSNPGHGEDLAFHAAQNGFSVVAAAGGDGTVHEVANGILRAGRPEIALAIFPIGSANDYAHSLGQDCEWWLRPGAGEPGHGGILDGYRTSWRSSQGPARTRARSMTPVESGSTSRSRSDHES